MTSMRSQTVAKNIRHVAGFQSGFFVANGVDDQLDFLGDAYGDAVRADANGNAAELTIETSGGAIDRFITAVSAYRLDGTTVTPLTGVSSFNAYAGARLTGTSEIAVIGVAAAAVTIRKTASGVGYSTVAPPAGTYTASAVWSAAANGTRVVFTHRNSTDDFIVYSAGGTVAQGDDSAWSGEKYVGCGYDEVRGLWVMATMTTTDCNLWTATDPAGSWTALQTIADVAPTLDMDFGVVCGVYVLALGPSSHTNAFPHDAAYAQPNHVIFASVDGGSTFFRPNAFLPARTAEPSRVRITSANGRLCVYHSDGIATSGSLAG